MVQARFEDDGSSEAEVKPYRNPKPYM